MVAKWGYARNNISSTIGTGSSGPAPVMSAVTIVTNYSGRHRLTTMSYPRQVPNIG
jgi:hypothetical protein